MQRATKRAAQIPGQSCGAGAVSQRAGNARDHRSTRVYTTLHQHAARGLREPGECARRCVRDECGGRDPVASHTSRRIPITAMTTAVATCTP